LFSANVSLNLPEIRCDVLGFENRNKSSSFRKYMEQIIKRIFSLSNGIRYIAIYANGKLASASRGGLQNASSSESDKYEELIVNPTLLTLVTQRGNIDCGGAEYVLIRYGNFFEFVKPVTNGHISVGIQLDEDPLKIIPLIEDVVNELGL
jgi:hypothetical protein